MLPTFVIGLREGLEAALIVGIIAAFLRQQGRRDLLRWVYLGVGAAVALCLAVGIALKVLSSNLPQKQQEGLETVVGVLAVGMVTYMVVWMRRHSRELKGQLEGLAAEAIGHGGGRGGRAMVLMAFLAVLREGFETVVFLLAAFNETSNTAGAAGGAAVGIVCAVALGYGIYRGGVRLNLSKFFRATGLVLVLVAAGLVVNALHTAHEAGWLQAGQGSTVDLTWLVRPGSVQSALLTGMLGIQPHPVVIEAIGWLVYLVPVGAYVTWPPGRALSRRTAARALGAVTALGAMVAIGLAAAAPNRPAPPPATSGDALSASLAGPASDIASVRTTTQSPVNGRSAGPPTTIVARRTGSASRGGIAVDVYSATVPGAGAAGRPATLTYDQAAQLNGGRLPLGVRPAAGAGSADAAVRLEYTDSDVLTVWVEPRTGRVIDLRWTETVRATLVGTPVGAVPLDAPVAAASLSLDPRTASGAAAAARGDLDALDQHSAMVAAARACALVALLGLAGLGVALAGRLRGKRAAGEPLTADLSSLRS
ncbi:MAG TPA: iron uptake transporter permease EfeU [Actinocrinis sp.]|nr:iron uptake transporter permease EfeU [Actinocrinis sp.]